MILTFDFLLLIIILFDFLKKPNLPHIILISLSESEDEELLRVKPERTVAEYCWTATPFTIYYVIKKFNFESCTYLDADVYFYLSLEIIFDEFGDNAILITEHRFVPKYIKEKKL